MATPPELTLLLESFDRNGRLNREMLDAIPFSDLDLSDGQGGRSIGQLLGELAAFRHGWLSHISPEHAEGIPSVIEGDELDYEMTAQSMDELTAAFAAGDAAAKRAVLDALEEGRSFEGAYTSHPGHFLQHILVHDAHHRGQIMTLLRQGGRPAEDMDALERATWPIWRE
jgi:uncharacterized damage-inducible protein DinB